MESVGSAVRRWVVEVDWTTRAAGFAAGVLVAWVVSTRWGFVVFLDGFLVEGRVLSIVGLVGISVLLLIGRVTRIWRRRGARPAPPPGAGPVQQGGIVESGARSVIIGLTLTIFTLLRLGGGFFGSDSVVLTPAAPAGCRIAAQETAAMLVGGGKLYQSGGGWGIGHPILDYSVDDGGRPFTTGNYRLTWTGSEGHLVLSTLPGALASPNVVTLRCG